MKSRTISILGVTFTVRPVAMEGLAGETDQDSREIRISPDLPEEVQIETFYHEVAHAMMGLTGVSHVLGMEKEEAVAQCLGFALSRFVSENESLPVFSKEVGNEN